MIRQDIKRAFISFGFVGVIGAYLTLMLNEVWYDYTNTLAGSLDTVWYLDYATSVSFLLLILPVIAGVPYATSFVSDWEHSYLRTVCFRTTSTKYCISKVITTYLSGGAVLAFATLLFIIFFAVQPQINMVNQEAIAHYVSNGGLLELLAYGKEGAFLFLACRVILIFMYGGMNALFALAVSAYCLNSYISLCIPFVFSRVWLQLIKRFDWPGYFNIGLMSKGTIIDSNGSILPAGEIMAIAVAIYLILAAIFGVVFVHKAMRRFKNA